jgi:hypothetical protein
LTFKLLNELGNSANLDHLELELLELIKDKRNGNRRAEIIALATQCGKEGEERAYVPTCTSGRPKKVKDEQGRSTIEDNPKGCLRAGMRLFRASSPQIEVDIEATKVSAPTPASFQLFHHDI